MTKPHSYGISLFTGLCIISLQFLFSCSIKEKAHKPNIILILADDLGVGDIQSHYPDNKIQTPNLDYLAAKGMSFSDAHSTSGVCSPSRYSLLTGRYNWRTPLQEWVLACYEPPLIETERTTLPEYLQSEGYGTACIGKWHLGWNWSGEQQNTRQEIKNILRNYNWDYQQPLSGGPLDHGFDYYFGTDVPNFPPFTYIENNKISIQPVSKLNLDEDYSARFIPKIFDGQPLAPNWKFDQILPDITRRAVEYIMDQSETGAPFFLYFSMTSPHEPVSPGKNFSGKSGIAPVADFIMETDWSVGQIIQAVSKAGISENTLIIFTADNGHASYTGWDELISAGHYPSGEFRGWKGDIWEGGHRVPMIACWPGQISAGSESSILISQTDIYATIHELLFGDIMKIEKAEDSFSFLNILIGKKGPVARTTMVNHSRNGEFAYRKDNWKLVFRMTNENLELSRGQLTGIELYNLENDPSEAYDSASFYQVKVNEMSEELRNVVMNGTSHEGVILSNDVEVVFETMQKKRWAKER